MKKHVALKWVKALRSGKYKQGNFRLQKGDTYCCLGVLCEIAPKSVSRQLEPDGRLFGVCMADQQLVKVWAGIDNCYRMVPWSLSKSLSYKNDTGASFEEIADFIEKHWEKL
jgi:hypothetical protein